MEQEKIKHEIKKESENAEHQPKKSKSDFRKYAMVAIIGVLLVFSVMQAFQINSLKEEFAGTNSVQTTGGSVSSSSQSAPSPAVQPSRPRMVGGC